MYKLSHLLAFIFFALISSLTCALEPQALQDIDGTPLTENEWVITHFEQQDNELLWVWLQSDGIEALLLYPNDSVMISSPWGELWDSNSDTIQIIIQAEISRDWSITRFGGEAVMSGKRLALTYPPVLPAGNKTYAIDSKSQLKINEAILVSESILRIQSEGSTDTIAGPNQNTSWWLETDLLRVEFGDPLTSIEVSGTNNIRGRAEIDSLILSTAEEWQLGNNAEPFYISAEEIRFLSPTQNINNQENSATLTTTNFSNFAIQSGLNTLSTGELFAPDLTMRPLTLDYSTLILQPPTLDLSGHILQEPTPENTSTPKRKSKGGSLHLYFFFFVALSSVAKKLSEFHFRHRKKNTKTFLVVCHLQGNLSACVLQ